MPPSRYGPSGMCGGRTWRAVALAGLLVTLGGGSVAHATTICVPTFGPGCKANGTNVAQANLETALGMNATDGISDAVVIQPHTYVDPDTLELAGTDNLTINGAGTDKTFITSSDNGNQFVMNFSAGSRATVLMRNLTLVIPASFPDDQGSALQLQRASLNNVNVISRNPGSKGLGSFVGANTVTGGVYKGESGGDFDDAIRVSGPVGASAVVEGVTIRDAAYGFTLSDGDFGAAVLRQSSIFGAGVAAVQATAGTATVENVFATTGNDAEAVSVNVCGPHDRTLNVRHMTAHPATGASSSAAAIDAVVGPTSNGDATANVSSSISGIPAHVHATRRIRLAARKRDSVADYDNVPAAVPQSSATDAGDGGFTFTNVINANPLFVSATSPILMTGSPSFDKGDPGSPTVTDIFGNPRPTEGGGGAPALPDQGAYSGTSGSLSLRSPKVRQEDQAGQGQVPVRVGRGGLNVRVQAGQAPLQPVRRLADLQQPEGRRAQVQGPRHRPGGQQGEAGQEEVRGRLAPSRVTTESAVRQLCR